MNWEQLKKFVYNEDGSLRDIYIRDVTTEDWRKWIDFVNNYCSLDFEIGGNPVGNKIAFTTISNHWQGGDNEYLSAAIYIENIIIKTIFSVDYEMEMDISPSDIKTINDHEKFVDHLKKVSLLLNKDVEVTEENRQSPDEVLMIIKGDQLIFPRQINT